MNETSYASQRSVRGAGIIFIDTVISMLFGFLSAAVIARFFPEQNTVFSAWL